MNTKHLHSLRAGINRMLEDGYKKIRAKHLNTYGFGDSEMIEDATKDWEYKNMLRILKPYKECEPDEYCIELLRFLDEKSPIKGYINWEK